MFERITSKFKKNSSYYILSVLLIFLIFCGTSIVIIVTTSSEDLYETHGIGVSEILFLMIYFFYFIILNLLRLFVVKFWLRIVSYFVSIFVGGFFILRFISSGIADISIFDIFLIYSSVAFGCMLLIELFDKYIQLKITKIALYIAIISILSYLIIQIYIYHELNNYNNDRSDGAYTIDECNTLKGTRALSLCYNAIIYTNPTLDECNKMKERIKDISVGARQSAKTRCLYDVNYSNNI
jgi:hypothetical protein